MKSWFSGQNDIELDRLSPILIELAKVHDVRKVISKINAKQMSLNFVSMLSLAKLEKEAEQEEVTYQ